MFNVAIEITKKSIQDHVYAKKKKKELQSIPIIFPAPVHTSTANCLPSRRINRPTQTSSSSSPGSTAPFRVSKIPRAARASEPLLDAFFISSPRLLHLSRACISRGIGRFPKPRRRRPSATKFAASLARLPATYVWPLGGFLKGAAAVCCKTRVTKKGLLLGFSSSEIYRGESCVFEAIFSSWGFTGFPSFSLNYMSYWNSMKQLYTALGPFISFQSTTESNLIRRAYPIHLPLINRAILRTDHRSSSLSQFPSQRAAPGVKSRALIRRVCAAPRSRIIARSCNTWIIYPDNDHPCARWAPPEATVLAGLHVDRFQRRVQAVFMRRGYAAAGFPLPAMSGTPLRRLLSTPVVTKYNRAEFILPYSCRIMLHCCDVACGLVCLFRFFADDMRIKSWSILTI